MVFNCAVSGQLIAAMSLMLSEFCYQYQSIVSNKFGNFCTTKMRIYSAIFTEFLCEYFYFSERILFFFFN